MVIRTPDQRLRVFVSSTLQELGDERRAAREAIERLHLAPVMFELGARPHPPRDLYRAYLDQSHIFVGIYWQKYGWIAPDMDTSGLEDEFNLSRDKPRLIYIKAPAPDREARLTALLDRIHQSEGVSVQSFTSPAQLRDLIENDLAMMLTEYFEVSQADEARPIESAPAAPRHNLPLSPTRLLGRETELAALREWLQHDDVSLITLTGPGGTGKSRLALQVVLDTLDRFEHGACFVNLAPITDPSLVADKIAQTLGLREAQGGPALRTMLLNYLRDKQYLLLLDNFEQVLDAAEVVAVVLQMCPRLKILVTSRAPLHLRSEREFPVAPLALPDIKQPIELERLSQYAAVQLFIQRAQDVRPDFTVTHDMAPAVAEICCRLDGLPLAIELAAARIKLLSPHAMLDRLERRLPLLTGGARDLPERQQTLRNTIAWSYNLLGDQTRRLFRRMAVFVGGWTLDAAEKVCNLEGDPDVDILNELAALVDNSLLKQSESLDGETRFAMLETIHEYALEGLTASSEAERLRERYARYYLDLVEATLPFQFNRLPEVWMMRLNADHDNLRAAIRWSSTADTDPDLFLRLVYATAWFWFLGGYLSEGYNWCTLALARTAALGHNLPRGRVYLGAGGLGFTIGHYAEARADLAESVAIAREFGDQPLLAYALTYQALAMTGLGDYEASITACTESITVAQALQQDWIRAFALRLMGDNMMMLHGIEAARPWYNDALQLSRRVGEPWLLSLPLRTNAMLSAFGGDYVAARALFEESIALMRTVGDRWGLAYAVAGFGYIVLRQNLIDEARRLFDESLTLAREVASTTSILLALMGYAGVATARGHPQRAAKLYGATDVALEALNVRWWPTERLVYDYNVALTRAQLDGSAWAAPYAEGRAMALNDAIAFALEDS